MEETDQTNIVAAVINNAVITPIMLQIIRDFEDFDLFQDELERNSEHNLEILENIIEDDTHNSLTNARNLIDSYITNDKEVANLTNLQKETENIRETKIELETQIENTEKVLEKQRKDLQKVDPKLQTMRDTVQAWKLATRVHFVYEGTSDVCGYAVGPTGKMKPFSHNPDKTTQKEITNALYEVMNSDKLTAPVE